MKVFIKQIEKKENEIATIEVASMTNQIKQAIELLEDSLSMIIGVKDQESYPIDVTKIYYIESIDNKTFIYVKNDCFESKLKLYELEELLSKDRFLRCSKSMILNIRKIKNLKPDFNARFVATLLNDESVVVSRSYTKELKKMLGL